MAEEKASGFWGSIPGMLTAAAAFITAIAALVGALVAADVIGPGSKRAADSTPTASSRESTLPRTPIELDRSPPTVTNSFQPPNVPSKVAR